MEKLRIDTKKGLYEIEVNDNGDTIIFDTEDIELPFKFNDAFIMTEQISKELKRKELLIKKKEAKENGFLTNIDEEYRKLMNNAYAQMREAMDKFLGEGGMQKIFGDRNYPSMYEDLLQALEPHMKALGIASAKSVERIKEKYGETDEDVME